MVALCCSPVWLVQVSATRSPGLAAAIAADRSAADEMARPPTLVMTSPA